MAKTNAERQRHYRERRADHLPVVRYRRPQDRASRPSRWHAAIQELRDLHNEYCEWHANMPESLQGTATGDKLAEMADLDLGSATLDDLEALELPLGFGRD